MVKATEKATTNLELLMDESMARHYDVEISVGSYFRNWTDWILCKPMSKLPSAPDKPGIFALGRWVMPPAGSGYLVLPFYFEQADDDLSSVIAPMVKLQRIFCAYNIIENREHRQTLLAALRKRQKLNADVDSAIGIVFPPVQDPNVLFQLPAFFPFG